MKKFLKIILTVITIFIVASSVVDLFNSKSSESDNSLSVVSNDNDVSFVSSDDLKAIAEKYADVPKLTGTEREALDKKINDIILSQLPEVEKTEALEALGVYAVYNSENMDYAASTSGDAVFSKPTISYASGTGMYIVTGNTSIPISDIKSEFTKFLLKPSVGDTKNIGNVDVLGLSLYNTSGNTTGLVIKNGYAKFYSGSGDSVSSVQITDDDCYGVAYEVQDRIRVTSVSGNWLSWKYSYTCNACSGTVVARYNEKFANYSGAVKTAWTHTWKSGEIEDISLSNSGFSVTCGNSSYSWTAKSNGRAFISGKQQ